MSTIRQDDFITSICDALQFISYYHPTDFIRALHAAYLREESPAARDAMAQILINSRMCAEGHRPICQDTGIVNIFLKVGMDVRWETDSSIDDMVNAAVRRAYLDPDNPLRGSIVTDPAGERKNTGDNTPPIVSYEIVPGDRVIITVMMKGFGAELMSRLKMFPPSVGVEGAKEFVLETVEKAGPNACPPVIIGVGLGSSFDGVARLAKKALLRPLDAVNPAPHLQQLEQDWLDAVNALGIGPQGFGGSVTALAVHIESFPTHIAALPVAVNLNCSAPRRTTVVI